MGAMEVCKQIGVSNHEFLSALQYFKGAGKRLQKVVEKKVIDDDDDKYLINEFQFQNWKTVCLININK